MNMMTDWIRACDMTVGYTARPVLSGIHLTARSGEFWSILGPNGSGKSTLVKTLLGMLPLLGGTLDISPVIHSASAWGFVPQRFEGSGALPMTVSEFVTMGMAGLSLSSQERTRRLQNALAALQLDRYVHESYHALSGGQKQRALIAAAIARQPLLLVLDEPTNGLDLPSQQQLMEVLRHWQRHVGALILLITHDLSLALNRADHLVLCHHGAVLAGPTPDVMDSREFHAAYGNPTAFRRIDGVVS